MASKPIKKGQWWVVRWQYPYPAWNQVKEINHDDALMAQEYVTGLHNRIADDDPRIVQKTYLTGSEPTPETITFGDVAVQMRAELSPDMQRVTDLALRHAGWLAQTPVDQVNHLSLNRRWHEMLHESAVAEETFGPARRRGKLSRNTIIQCMGRFTSILKFAWIHEQTRFDVIRARATKGTLKFPGDAHRSSGRLKSLTAEEANALIAAMPTPQDRLIAWVMVMSGARISEVLALAVGDFNVKRGEISLNFKMDSRGRRVVGIKAREGVAEASQAKILSTDLTGVLAGWCEGRPATAPMFPDPRETTQGFMPTWIWRKVFDDVVDALVEAEVLPAGVTPHWTRHTTATRMADVTTPAHIKHQLGHSSLKMSQHYMGVDEQTRREIRAALDSLAIAAP